jgi:DNA-binding XRE family transcriptional regulator
MTSPTPTLTPIAVEFTRHGEPVKHAHLGRAVGVSPSTISLISTGKRKPSIELFAAIAEYLEMPMEDLYAKLQQAQTSPEKEE